MSSLVKYAVNSANGKITHVQDAANGLGCNCRCVACNERLEAVQGRVREWHFRHNSNKNCKGGIETALHKLAKQIIAEHKAIAIPGTIISYGNPRIEHRLGEFVTDVSVDCGTFDVHFEVVVTHPVDTIKKAFYTNHAHKSIEIDLRGISYDITPGQLRPLVLEKMENRKFIFWERPTVDPPSKKTSDTWKIILSGILLVSALRVFDRWLHRNSR